MTLCLTEDGTRTTELTPDARFVRVAFHVGPFSMITLICRDNLYYTIAHKLHNCKKIAPVNLPLLGFERAALPAWDLQTFLRNQQRNVFAALQRFILNHICLLPPRPLPSTSAPKKSNPFRKSVLVQHFRFLKKII